MRASSRGPAGRLRRIARCGNIGRGDARARFAIAPFATMHCPSLIVFGTFFPAWMLCALVGIVGAAAARALLGAVRLDEWLQPKLLVYPSLSLGITFACWLHWFGN